MDAALAYRIPEAARRVGVGRTMLFQAARQNQLKVRKVGRATIVLHDDLLAWIRALPVKKQATAEDDSRPRREEEL